MTAHDMGHMAEYESQMADFFALDGEDHHPFYIPYIAAETNAYVGDLDAAFDWLEKAVDADETQAFKEVFDPFLQNLHEDPRWDEYRERMGLSRERLGAIDFRVRFPD